MESFVRGKKERKKTILHGKKEKSIDKGPHHRETLISVSFIVHPARKSKGGYKIENPNKEKQQTE